MGLFNKMKESLSKTRDSINEKFEAVIRSFRTVDEELFEEYKKYPLITKQRMFYETMEDILPDMKVVITKSDGSTQTMLPLESFANLDAGAKDAGAGEKGGAADEEN